MGKRFLSKWVGVAAAGAMLLAACNDGDELFAPSDRERVSGGVVGVSSSAPTLLRSPESCDDLVAGLRDLADETMLGRGSVTFDMDIALEATVEESAAAPAADAAAGGSTSTTNTQEVGIDEPDLVETDGDFVYTLDSAGDVERLVILDAASAQVVGSLDLGTWGNQLLLSGDRLLAISGGGYAYGPMPMPMPIEDVDVVEPEVGRAPTDGATEPGSAGSGDPGISEPLPVDVEPIDPVDPVDPPVMPVEPPSFHAGTTIQLIDVADRSNPVLVETTELEGLHNTTRVVDGVARIVISSYPAIEPMSVEGDYEDELRTAIDEAGVEDLLPSYRTITAGQGEPAVSSEGEIVPCEQVLVPDVNAGSAETSILRVDFEDGFDPADTTTVVADAGTVYASADTLYLAATQWTMAGGVTPESGIDTWSTAVHAFDLTGDGAAVHLAAGEVPGSVLNQYSMSEHAGDLRIATTEGGFDDSHSGVRVLRRNGDTFDEIGAVTGLGLTETIQSVRFMGDTAYVVTFRQTDPLYVIDLSDPANPEAVGELKIPGFSSYLHPIGDDLLVGIGRNADDQGRDTGFLMSVFDVSDPTDPIQVDTFSDPTMYSAAGSDPKAFLWWPDEGAIVVPFEAFSPIGVPEGPGSSDGDATVSSDATGTASSGLLVVDAGADGLSVRGTVSAGTPDSVSWTRALVVQGDLWGLYTDWSAAPPAGGVAVTDFDDLGSVTQHPFG